MTNFQEILNLQAQAVLDSCKLENCAMCPDIAKDARRWYEMDGFHREAMALLLLAKVRKDFTLEKKAND
jgi:hypothetical protein